MGRRVEKTRNNGTMSESQYWGTVRSALRRQFRYWKPAIQCKIQARRKYKGENRRQKWEVQCKQCHQWFKDKDVQIDHIVPVGSLNLLSDTGFNSCKKLCIP